jgi:hypothetical protein
VTITVRKLLKMHISGIDQGLGRVLGLVPRITTSGSHGGRPWLGASSTSIKRYIKSTLGREQGAENFACERMAKIKLRGAPRQFSKYPQTFLETPLSICDQPTLVFVHIPRHSFREFLLDGDILCAFS